jgi:hypothetical protein
LVPLPPPPLSGYWLKIFKINRKDWLTVAQWLGLGLKGLICTIDR